MITQSSACYPEDGARHDVCSGHVVVQSSSGLLLNVDCTCWCHDVRRRVIRAIRALLGPRA